MGIHIHVFKFKVNADDETDIWATTSLLGGTGDSAEDGDYWIRTEFDLTNFVGQVARILLVDAMNGESCSWFAVDDFMWVPTMPVSSTGVPLIDGVIYTEGALFEFEDCSSDGWASVGNFQVVDASSTWVYKISSYMDENFVDFADTFKMDNDDDCQVCHA